MRSLNNDLSDLRVAKKSAGCEPAQRLIKNLFPFTKKEYIPPEGKRPYEKLRHKFISAMDLDLVYTPCKAVYDYSKREMRVGRTYSTKIGAPDPPKEGQGARVILPRAKLMHEFPFFLRHSREILHISHMVVQCGLPENSGIIQDLRGLRRLFWQVDWAENFRLLARRVRIKLSTVGHSAGLSAKPVPLYRAH